MLQKKSIGGSLSLRVAIASALGLGIVTATPAQDAPDRREVETVIVTGSFIRGTPEDAAVPVDVLSAEDLDNVDTTLRLLGESLVAQDRGRVRVNNNVLYREATGGGHIMGTTRMGRSRADSVVDRDCRVHGYDNFFVAGSSVFTTGGFANPTFTIVALAVRLADEIARRG